MAISTTEVELQVVLLLAVATHWMDLSMSFSRFGHHTYILANDFIFVMQDVLREAPVKLHFDPLGE